MVLKYNVVYLIPTSEQYANTPKTENKVMMIFSSCVIRITTYWNSIGTTISDGQYIVQIRCRILA